VPGNYLFYLSWVLHQVKDAQYPAPANNFYDFTSDSLITPKPICMSACRREKVIKRSRVDSSSIKSILRRLAAPALLILAAIMQPVIKSTTEERKSNHHENTTIPQNPKTPYVYDDMCMRMIKKYWCPLSLHHCLISTSNTLSSG
jgi:hypothetical protein